MLKRSKKTVCILMCLALIMTLCAGCNGKKATGEKGVVDIHMTTQINPEITLANNPVVALIKKDLGINLIIEAPPQNGYSDRLKVEIAAGNMPDMFIGGTDVDATNWAKENLFVNLTNLIKSYPNLEKNISAQQWGDTKLLNDNNIWGVPRPNSYDKWGFIINKTWLTKLGLKAPKTVEEFNAVCKAFTQGDPNGNGKADTYGVAFGAQQSSINSGVWHMYNDFLATAYNISDWNNQMPDKDGSFTLRAYKSEYYDYLTELRNLFSQNIIDRDFVTFKGTEPLDAFAQGRVGIIGASETGFVKSIITKYNLKSADYEFCPPLTLDSSSKPTYVLSPSNWMAFYINAKSTHIADCLRLLDWGNSQAGFVAMQLGIKGTDYNSYDVHHQAG
jgi:putative aldouronate transport system substrate-binding protein